MTTLNSPPAAAQRTRRRPSLERQAIGFTVGLYLFIFLALLLFHYAAPYLAQP
ncbi:MAG: hypothetical protein LBH76_07265 [Propionibacteriaceae bacterium]|jgi:cytochrome c1|nr:hypothetical protein [Propionibacteriaceae bacterium]